MVFMRVTTKVFVEIRKKKKSQIYCLPWEAEARYMYCFSSVVGVGGGVGVNFCPVFAFRSFSREL